MKRLLVVLTCLPMAACKGTPAATYNPAVTVGVPSADGGSTVPYEQGGTFTVAVDVKGLTAPNGARALVELTNANPPMGSVVSVTAPLTFVSDSGANGGRTGATGELRGQAQLVWPTGGPLSLRVTAVGTVVTNGSFSMVTPTLRLSNGPASAGSAAFAVPVCLETSATAGTISISLTNATLSTGEQKFNATIAAGPCLAMAGDAGVRDAGAAADGGATFGSASFTAFATAPAFQIDAELVGSSVETQVTVPVETNQPITIQIVPAQNATPLPADGETIVPLSVTAKLGASALSGFPISFQTIPMTDVLPSTAVTDADGGASISLVVPKDVTSVRIDGVLGAGHGGTTVSR